MKLGKAFSDYIVIDRKKSKGRLKETGNIWWLGAGRLLVFMVVLTALFFLLVIRLFDLTIVKGHEFRLLSDGNRIRELVRHAPRGVIRDRTGKELVINEPRYRVIKPCENPGKTGEGDDLGCTGYLSFEEGEAWKNSGLPEGNFLEFDFGRIYKQPESLAQIIGYTGEISSSEVSDDYYKLRGYNTGDKIGRVGAEAVYEDSLRGRNGKELVEIDSGGSIVRLLGVDHESKGTDIILSADADLSLFIYKAFPRDKKGAVVVSKPDTGEILALFSSPSYDNNIFSRGISSEDYQDLISDPDNPMFNRSIGGEYPPGSIFKIITAIAALEEGIITPETQIEDTGIISVGQFSFSNWYYTQYGKTDGMVDMVKGLQRSNDIYFYKIGEKTGIENIAKWARIAGLGKPLGIELSGEASGLMPDPQWKSKYFNSSSDIKARNNKWYQGDTYHISIGQGYLLATPLQVNFWTNIIANGGNLCLPTIEKIDGKTHKSVCKNLGLGKETLAAISLGLERACQPGGTGWPFFNFGINPDRKKDKSSSDLMEEIIDSDNSTSSANLTTIPVACKTGTAEIGDREGKTHAWFTVFAPLKEEKEGTVKAVTGSPEISVTVLVEEGGEGSYVAAPIARKILEYWFSR